MKAIIQRVNSASVAVNSKQISSITKGLLIFLGITHSDTEAEVKYVTDKILNLRLFPQNDQEFDLSVLETKYEILIVSQFTLYGSCDKGRRPDFNQAAKPDYAETLYERAIQLLRKSELKIETGEFGAHMIVSLENDGPATFIIEKNSL